MLQQVIQFSLSCFFFAVTLKNAAELLEFSAMYNAEQLKLSCLQFIGLNMAALLEARWGGMQICSGTGCYNKFKHLKKAKGVEELIGTGQY